VRRDRREFHFRSSRAAPVHPLRADHYSGRAAGGCLAEEPPRLSYAPAVQGEKESARGRKCGERSAVSSAPRSSVLPVSRPA